MGILSSRQFQCRTRLCGWCSLPNGVRGISLIGVSMPHAALWVVQQTPEHSAGHDCEFQCRTRLCGWCSLDQHHFFPLHSCFNAARGFVGGAAILFGALTTFFAVSMPHAALWVVQQNCGDAIVPDVESFNAARGFVGGAARSTFVRTAPTPCFNAARGFVGGAASCVAAIFSSQTCFNAARGFVGGAAFTMLIKHLGTVSFNAARGFVGGAASLE